MSSLSKWSITQFNDTYEVIVETDTSYLIYTLSNTVQIKDLQIIDCCGTSIETFVYKTYKGVAIQGGHCVSNTFIPVPDDLYNDIQKYISNGLIHNHKYICTS